MTAFTQAYKFEGGRWSSARPRGSARSTMRRVQLVGRTRAGTAMRAGLTPVSIGAVTPEPPAVPDA